MHHLLVSGIYGPNIANSHLTLPKELKMIDIWCLLYSIMGLFGVVMWQLPQIVWTYFRILEVSAFIIGCIFIIRIVVLTIGYAIYFSGDNNKSENVQE